jgi:predicted ATPase/DNA-binding winged helix-turn-helix (wHTH) protein
MRASGWRVRGRRLKQSGIDPKIVASSLPSPVPSNVVGSVDQIRIGGFVLDRTRRELLEPSGSPAPLRHKALEVLLALGAQAGHVVSKDELLLQVWPSVVVTDDSLTQAIAEIRRCLGDTRHRWIRTAVRRGYCLEPEAQPASSDPEVATVRGATRPLPVIHGPLLGRDADRSAVRALVREARLVTLVGTGGIGKTRLALAVAEGLADPLDHNVWWVDLALAPDAQPLAPYVASAACVELPLGDALAALVSALRDERGLLVLDNCEHRIDEVAALAMAVLTGAPEVRLLATSQAALDVTGEQVYRLNTLECPAVGTTLDQARRSPAFALLEQRAREADHGFGIDHDGVAPAIELCRRLDGIPLALEMAAARLPAVGVSGVLRLLGERLTLLKRTHRDVPARHETLQATLAWSCSLLNDTQRAALYALAVFAGPFDSTMAHVVTAPQASAAACVDTLCTLVDRSLLRVESGDPVHYRLYESMRLYALAQLRASGGETQARQRHGVAMAAHAGTFRDAGRLLSDEAVLSRFGATYADFEQALTSACKRRDIEVVAQTLDALRGLDQLRGELSATERRLAAVQPLLPNAAGRTRALILSTRASSGWVDLPEWPAAMAADAAVQAWRALGDESAQLHHALLLLGTERARAGDCSGAQQALGEAFTLRAAGTLSPRRSSVFVHEGHVAILCGRWQQGLDHLRTALALARQSGATRLACYVLLHLTDAALLAGDPKAALDYAETAVRETRACRARHYLAYALLSQIEAALAAGCVDGAVAAAGEALALAADYGLHANVAPAFAALAMRTGQPAPACRLLGHARARQQQCNHLDRHAAQRLEALRCEAEACLGAQVVLDLLHAGAQLGADDVLALAAQVA